MRSQNLTRRDVIEDPELAYKSALNLLSYRKRTRLEMEQRLGKRFSKRAIEGVIRRLIKVGYLDDLQFAKDWTEGRGKNKPRSGSLIRSELRKKGIENELVLLVTADVDDDSNAYSAGLKHVRALNGVPRQKVVSRLTGYLQRRGFSTAVVLRTVNKLALERDQWC